MTSKFFAFGEILWDCLPSGRHAGGAPFNVAIHLAQLGAPAALISSAGRDAMGDELLQVARDKKVDTQFVTRARAGLSTGTVLVTIDANGNAAYDLVQPVAWDEIEVSEKTLEAVAQGQALIFGSLACRSPYNLAQLDRLLQLSKPMKFFDDNLRPPFADPTLVLDLAKRADVLKLNDEEAGRLASWLRTGEMALNTPRDSECLAAVCAVLAEATGTERLCVTRGGQGAALWDRGILICAAAPQITVRDTVGAGDAFMAGLVAGLTRNLEIHHVMESACRLGAYVASQQGATPLLPAELVEQFGENEPAG